MFCKHCGQPLDTNAAFCTNCGINQQAAMQPPVPMQPVAFCDHCGLQLIGENTLCQRCGTTRAKDSPLHTVPIIITVFAFIVCFGILGGDPEIYEVNLFDYIAGILGLVALVMSIAIIPKRRRALRIISIVLSVLMIVFALGWVLMHGP